MINPLSLENKTILITGASSGIGKATALLCSQLGARLIITGKTISKLNDTYNLLSGKRHLKILTDYEDDVSVDDCINSIDVVDGIVHSAGILDSTPLKFTNRLKMSKIMKVNFEIPFYITVSLLKNKKIRKEGSLVFISSIAGINKVVPGLALYSASKGALSSSIRVMALELASQKIRVNAICPGMVRTEMIDSHLTVTKEQFLDDEKRNYPLGYGNPEDVANAAAFLLSDAGRWITGTNLIIDGGASIH